VSTCAELDQAMKIASGGDTAAYIEVITDTYATPLLAQRLQDSQETFYGA
jgi:indolepyruvate decarboxylase